MTPYSRPDFDRDSLSIYEGARNQERKAEYERLHVLHDKDTVKPPDWWTTPKEKP